MGTVLMIGPDGSSWDIPQDKVKDALANGGKLAQDILGPDGQRYAIPLDKVHDAINKGGQLVGSSGVSQPNVQMQQSTLGKVYNVVSGDDVAVNPTGEATVHERYTGNDHKVLTMKPGESYEDFMKRVVEYGKTVTPEQLNSANENNIQMSKNIGIGAAKSAGQTAMTVSDIGKNVMTLGLGSYLEPDSVKEQRAKIDNALQIDNEDQQIGQNLETILEFALGDEALKGLSLGEKLAQGSKLAKFIEKYPRIANVLGDALRSGTVGGTVGGIHGGTEGAVEGAIGGAVLGGGISALGDLKGVASEAGTATKSLFSKGTGLAEDAGTFVKDTGKGLFKGAKAAQPGAQTAVRDAVTASAEKAGTATPELLEGIESKPLMNGNETVLDDHLKQLFQNEKAAYKSLDDTVGFDLKAEKKALANDKYKLDQLGNTDADITQRGKLIESINDSEARIAEAQAKLKTAGIDPKAPDTIHQQRMAGMEFKKALVKNTNVDGSVNIDGLLNDAKKMRFNPKYGDRLGQFIGKEGADQFISQLQQMQKLGAHAVKARQVAKWLGGLGLLGGGAHTIIKGIETVAH